VEASGASSDLAELRVTDGPPALATALAWDAARATLWAAMPRLGLVAISVAEGSTSTPS
jgi:hypothetical protein